MGSGFVVGEDGTVLTNYHLVRRAIKGEAIFQEGSHYEIRNLKVFNRLTDLAVLKISADKKFPVCSLGDSDKVKPRDKVLAVGNPLGNGLNITEGIVSQASRDDLNHMKRITHTATITSGNSGGALYSKDEIIGVNVAIQVNPTVGGATGFNYAIPINKAKGLLTGHDRLVPLESAFPSSLDQIMKKAKSIKEHKGKCAGSKGEKAGTSVFSMELTKLTDYMIAVESPGKRLAVVAMNSRNNPIGIGNKDQLGYQGLLIGAQDSEKCNFVVLNRNAEPADFVVKIYQLKW